VFMKECTSGKVPREKTINRQVLPHAPSPTMTNLRRISDIFIVVVVVAVVAVDVYFTQGV
jgi:hypothetical protein